MSLVPHDLQRQLDGAGADPFRRAVGQPRADPLRGETPVLAIRVQELFGLDRHPAIADGTVPLTLELLSPAHRPIQTTRDLPGFWRGSWAEVRAEMRGRYPQPCLAGRPAERRRHQPRQAARQIALGGARRRARPYSRP